MPLPGGRISIRSQFFQDACNKRGQAVLHFSHGLAAVQGWGFLGGHGEQLGAHSGVFLANCLDHPCAFNDLSGSEVVFELARQSCVIFLNADGFWCLIRSHSGINLLTCLVGYQVRPQVIDGCNPICNLQPWSHLWLRGRLQVCALGKPFLERRDIHA
ncbi:hypothetical protein [Gluconacetobacter entanii]|uniref:hypothetical protein n=1 Tax=Gluconacetobacter entanii TaxID=108528 RepID=UPI00142DF0A4|nr:hypothetical protein [Gluconacetobacter entanii]